MFGDKKFMNQQKNKIERLNQVEKGKKKKKKGCICRLEGPTLGDIPNK